MENDSQKAGRHRNDTRKDTRLHCSDFSALKNPTTYSDTRSSPLLHLEDRSDHHVLLVVVELVHHIFCLLQELTQRVWQRYFFKLRNCLLKTQSSSVSCVGPVYLVIFCCWVGPGPYLELFWAGPVKKVTLYKYIFGRKMVNVLHLCRGGD